MRMRARQGGEVVPVDEAVCLGPEPAEHTGVGEPIRRVDLTGASRAELGLDRYPSDEGGVEGG